MKDAKDANHSSRRCKTLNFEFALSNKMSLSEVYINLFKRKNKYQNIPLVKISNEAEYWSFEIKKESETL